MEKFAMLPAVTRPTSSRVHRSLEDMMQAAIDDVSRLRSEIAELKSIADSLRTEISESLVEIRGDQRPKAVVTKRADPDFDWEAWARETKARIRGEHLAAGSQ